MKAKELKKTLELVKPGLARKELLDQATSVVFRDDFVWTFNDEVAVKAALSIGITGAIPSEPLYAFLSRIDPEAEIGIEADAERGELKFSAGRKRASIRLDSEIRLPLDEELTEPEEWNQLPDEFVRAVRACLFSASRSGNLPILTCVHIMPNYSETCDEYRCTRYNSGLTSDNDNGVKVVSRHLEKLDAYHPKEYGYSGNWLHFRNSDGVLYCVRMVDGQYPDLSAYLEVKGVDVEFPAELDEALDWVSVSVDEAIKFDQRITVELVKGKMMVSGEGSDSHADMDVRFKYTGPNVKFDAHPAFLRDMSKIARKITIGKSALRIEGENFIHSVSLDNEE